MKDWKKELQELQKRREKLEEKSEQIARELNEVRKAEEGLRHFVQYKRYERGLAPMKTAEMVRTKPSMKVLEQIITGQCKGKKTADAAEYVLREAGRPLQVKELCRLLRIAGIKSNAKNPRTVLTLALRRFPDRFVRPENGVWALVEWGEKQEEERNLFD